MTHVHTVWDFSDEHLVRQAVRPNQLAVNPEPSVSDAIHVAKPYPTTGLGDHFYLFQKAVFNAFLRHKTPLSKKARVKLGVIHRRASGTSNTTGLNQSFVTLTNATLQDTVDCACVQGKWDTPLGDPLE